MLDKRYDFNEIEPKIAAALATSDIVKCDPDSVKPAFTIMMPPPNVTGRLHMGHGLNYTLQDVLARFKRMCGFDVLWQPGTDHAGIATQMVVERDLGTQNITKHDLGREKFIEKVWQWREKYGQAIIEQQQRLGVSADWSRSRFTMDKGLNEAVREVFVKLYKDDLIFRGEKLVNWDCKLLTAVSDLEVERRETDGKFYYIKYQIAGDITDDIASDKSIKHLVIATTRPETMFGDSALAVNPNDERYTHLIGKHAIIPISRRQIPIIADEHSDMEKGSGVVKITPAHDFDDFAVGERHNLAKINIMNANGTLNDNVPAQYVALDRFEARSKLVQELKDQELLEKQESRKIMTPYGDRSGSVIEPRLTKQWFVDAKVLAKKAITVVEDNTVQFIPKHWDATYFEWLRNIEPWCISRQIWWGHQIPAWYGPDGHIFVAHDQQEAMFMAKKHYGLDKNDDKGEADEIILTQESDVLDTWFSSALWPFSTLGWPQQTKELERYYPSQVLVTGFDIIFFWVARMVMMGLYCRGDIPFSTVYINALVRDDKGQKMSKSKGNVIDPMILIDKYSADALRFTLSTLAAPGTDLKFNEKQVEGNRNFITKIWNATRFLLGFEAKWDAKFDPKTVKYPLNRAIVHECVQLCSGVEENLTNNRFDLAAKQIYQFVWHNFCDWHLEMIKPILFGKMPQVSDKDIAEVKATSMWVLGQILHVLHPFMPFITQHLYNQLIVTDGNGGWLMANPWPNYNEIDYFEDKNQTQTLQNLISLIRSLRMQLDVPVANTVNMQVSKNTPNATQITQNYAQIVDGMAKVNITPLTGSDSSDSENSQSNSSKYLHFPYQGGSISLEIGDMIDVNSQKERLEKSLAIKTKSIKQLEGKLNNQSFVDRAPIEILQKVKSNLKQANQEQIQIQLILSALVVE